LYASDLAGAALGCLLVLGGLDLVDAPSLALVCASAGGLAAIAFAWPHWSRNLRLAAVCTLGVLVACVVVNTLTPFGIHPTVVKGRKPGTLRTISEKWNSFSRVVIYEGRDGNPQYWAASPKAPEGLMIYQHRMDIDGEAATTLRRFASLEDIIHLGWDVTNIAYYLRPTGGVCVIGVGGGRDIQSAILFGHEKITGVEVNPIFVRLLKDDFRNLAGIADYPGVTLVTDEARSYLSRTRERYALIQMSLTDTWAATGAGAFSLSENALYTVEAWTTFLRCLSDKGLFTVSRWYDPDNLGETGRTVSLAVAALARIGSARPDEHIAMVASGQISTLIVGARPMDEADVDRLRSTCDRLEFQLVMCPGQPPEHPLLERVLAGDLARGADQGASDQWLDFDPPTDERPYFFNMTRPGKALASLWSGAPYQGEPGSGVVSGNVVAVRFLVMLVLCLVVLSVATVIFPLVLGGWRAGRTGECRSPLWPAARYFCLIGAGFMFAEIALIQRLSVFLGHPMYALGVLLFSIIASAGLGSFLSDRLPLSRTWWMYGYPIAVAAAIIGIRFALPWLAVGMVSSSMPAKILASVLACVPLGCLLGFGFPTGMRLVRDARAAETPWYWALNGIFGVLSSALAVVISVYSGISVSLYIAALCYTLIVACVPGLLRARQAEAAGTQESGRIGPA
jgi:hypothetical protein